MARHQLLLLVAAAVLAAATLAAADMPRLDADVETHDRSLQQANAPDCTHTVEGCRCIPFWTNAFDVTSTNNCAAPPDDPWQPWCIVQGACRDNRWGYCDRRCLDNPPPPATDVPAWLVDLSLECPLPLDDATRPDLTSGVKFTMFGEAHYYKRSCDLALLCSEQGVCNLPEGLTCYDYWNATVGSFVARPTDITLLWARHDDDVRTLHQFIINVQCGDKLSCVARNYGAGFMGATLSSPDACPTEVQPESATITMES